MAEEDSEEDGEEEESRRERRRTRVAVVSGGISSSPGSGKIARRISKVERVSSRR